MEGDAAKDTDQLVANISIHSLRVEGDKALHTCVGSVSGFQSTPSVWRETKTAGIHGHSAVISIHSLRVEGDAKLWFNCNPDSPISIHSLRVEGDRLDDRRQIFGYISIHSLRVEGDYLSWAWAWAEINFNPLPPCGGRLIDFTTFKVLYGISIHSLRVEGDNYAHRFQHFVAYFNPLPPCGGRLVAEYVDRATSDFNPLPPCGGRRKTGAYATHPTPFQSTPSVWRETQRASDFLMQHRTFQSTPSVWRETRQSQNRSQCFPISIHSLRVEGDDALPDIQYTRGHFNPLPPCGGRPQHSDLLL